ncbi:hypothetical protein ACWFRF_15590 [Nocardia sp. NPDC055165]
MTAIEEETLGKFLKRHTERDIELTVVDTPVVILRKDEVKELLTLVRTDLSLQHEREIVEVAKMVRQATMDELKDAGMLSAYGNRVVAELQQQSNGGES